MLPLRNRALAGGLVVAGLSLLSLLGMQVPSFASTPGQGVQAIVVPTGVTAGVAVFDRQTGTFTEQLNQRMQFRSASVVKLLLVLDFLWNRGPAYSIPPADQDRLDVMLRSSDDDAASYYWSQLGQSAVVTRMVSRLGLQDTAPPPAGYPGFWGYVALSAADTVKIYRYLLDSAPAPVRDYVMGNLQQATRCGTDGFDQYFGIASVFDLAFSVKQGWSGFTRSGGCGSAFAAASESSGTKPVQAPAAVDLVREALHTTGTVGVQDRSIVAVFTLHPDGSAYGTAYRDVTRLVRSLNVPGAIRAEGSWFGTWGSGVRVRSEPTTSSEVLATLPAGVDILAGCQKQGQLVNVPPYSNSWWTYLPKYGGYLTNIYVSTPGSQLPGVPVCSW